MDFNDRATGDAALLVAITQLLIALGTGTSIGALLNPFTLFSVLLSGLIFWLMYSGACYAIVRFLFEGSGSFPIYLRVAGFAYPTLLLLIVGDILFSSFVLILLVGAAWFVVIVAHGVMYIGDIDRQKSFIAAIGAYAAVMVVQAILASIRIF